MFRPKVYNAKPLLALTAFLIPWDVFAFGRNIGWGLTFAFGRWVVQSKFGHQFLTTLQLLSARSQFTPHLQIGLYLWTIAGAIVFLMTTYTVLKRVLGESYRSLEQRAIGTAFVLAGTLFIASRFFFYRWLLLSPQRNPHWFSIPFGGVYVVAIGVIFLKNWF